MNWRGGELSNGSTIRLRYLDGLRGLAVSLIVLHHLYLRWFDPSGTGRLAYGLPSLVQWGRLGVDTFIVLSGYSLMIPVARSADGRLPGGLVRYARRRARRILPAYYAGLLFSLLPLIPVAVHRMGAQSNAATPPLPLTAGSLVAHLLLLHNLRPDWAHQINGPLWSLATEWQIYFIFPLLLLPLWQRAGSGVTVLVAAVVGLAAAAVPALQLQQAAPWYLGLFALGMAGAVANFGRVQPQPPQAWNWWPPLGIVAAAGVVWVGIRRSGNLPLFESLGGIVIMTLLVDQTRRAMEGDRIPRPPGRMVWRNLGRRLLESRLLVWLGTISYSLYLIHQPMLTTLDTLAVQRTHWSTAQRIGLESLCVPGLIVAAAMVFHRLVERRFMPGRPKTLVQAAQSAALEPAV